MTSDEVGSVEVPAGCTLPTAQRPLRVLEFAQLLRAVRAVDRLEPTRLVLVLPSAPGRADGLRDLARRETGCCTFFRFTVQEQEGTVSLDVVVPPTRAGVLDALAERARGVAARRG